jgi:hypothetical protein
MKGGAGGGSYFPVTAIQKFDSKVSYLKGHKNPSLIFTYPKMA